MLRLLHTLLIILTGINFIYAQKSNTELSLSNKAHLLVEVLNKNHCQAQNIDNNFSQKLSKSFLKALDPKKDILTKEDITKLGNIEFTLDDQIKSKNIIFIPKVVQVLKRRYAMIDSTLKILSERPINFKSPLHYIATYDSAAISDTELKLRIQKNLKYMVFSNIYDNILDTATNSLPKDYLDEKKLAEKEKIAKGEELENYRLSYSDYLTESNESLIQNLETLFLETVALSYDSHTEYFGYEEVTAFRESMNPKKEIFGFSIDENKDQEIIISGLYPGGPAWNTGLINEGDILLNFKFEGKKSISVSGKKLKDIDELFDNNNSEKLDITIKKATKDIQTVSLSKVMVTVESEAVRGLILEKNDKFGYINLPTFYTDVESDETLGCANDVAKELVKMKQDNIKGLILDLRFNGGGSVGEALDLAGIFIDQGVFGAAKPAKGKSILLKDPNRGSIYDGPLVLLVNQLSASASEILAGILKDYNRAVIVGSTTFGKGVAQSIITLDSLSKDPKYFAKTTVWRVYSPSGNAIQQNGIEPHVILPSVLDGESILEKNEVFSLLPIALDRNLMISPEPELPIQSLKENSQKRLKQSKDFNTIVDISNNLMKMVENKKKIKEYTWESFCKEKLEFDNHLDTLLEKIDSKTILFKVQALIADQERSKIDESWNKLNKKLFEEISQDIYINESIEILKNLNK